MCELASWIPNAVAVTLRDAPAPPIIAWLTTLRDSTEEYDPLVAVRPQSSASDEDASSSDSAFDEILSHLGTEIFKLDQYQRNLVPVDTELSLSILDIFDECLDTMIENKDKPECSDESSMTDISFVTSTPRNDSPRARLKTDSTSSSIYDVEIDKDCHEWTKLIESSSDSESTCWSYKECSDTDTDVNKVSYAAMWAQSSGFHNSDAILRRVLSQNQATVSRLSFDTADDFAPPDYNVYALAEVGDRCSVTMSPARPADDGYEPVRDALTNEHIYEDIEFDYSYTDEGCSRGTSVEVESCSISASSGRDSPLYANLRDHDAYAVTQDVIFWKNLLLDPFYNDDEEDEWITPEECAVYSREQRPPLVIPRITQYRPPRQRPAPPQNHNYPEDTALKSSFRQYERLGNWSPQSERGRAELEHSFSKADSPPFNRINKRLGGSTENLLVNPRRPHHLQLPPSSSGDSLDIEIRDKDLGHVRTRKTMSMVGPKHRLRSPVPAPRIMVPHPAVEASVLLEGPVKRTKFFEGGKKSKKNWNDCYMVLTHTALYFYKDQRTYYASKVAKPAGTPPSPSAPRAEMVLALRNARVLQCIPTHTRRHSRSLVLTVDYDQYLIQDETEEGAKRWLQAIHNVIYSLYPPMTDSPTPQYQSSNTDLESLGRTPPVSRQTRTKQKAGGSSNEDLSDSTESTQKSHVRSRLRKFFAKRPSMEVLVKKGIYKDEPVFGRNLDEVCPAASPRVPEFVVACVKEIESSEENMCTDGLYRASGNLSQVQKIRLEIDQNNLSVIENNTDIHVLTGSLKLFFRELKEPLIPCSIFDRVLAACSIKPKEAKLKEFRDIIQSLPQCNRDTLKYLLEHLIKVTQYSEKNRMHTANLAIVFGPTLLWAPAEQAHNIAVDCIQQNNVVDILLNEFKEIFPDDAKSKKKA